MIDVGVDVRDAVQSHGALLATLATIIVATLMLARIGTKLVPRMSPSASLIASVVRITVFSIGALVALGTLGISVTPLLTALGVGGLAVALALRDTLANVFAGLQLLATRQVRTGDFIRFDGGEGYLTDIAWRSATIRDASGALILIPNEKLAGAIVVNASDGVQSRIAVSFAVPAAREAHAVLIAATRTLDALRGASAFVRVSAMSEASTSFVVDVELRPREDAFAVRVQVLHAIAQTLATLDARGAEPLPPAERPS